MWDPLREKRKRKKRFLSPPLSLTYIWAPTNKNKNKTRYGPVIVLLFSETLFTDLFEGWTHWSASVK
jgi:hypothetical protein